MASNLAVKRWYEEKGRVMCDVAKGPERSEGVVISVYV